MEMRRRDVMVGLGALVGHDAAAATLPWLSPDLPDGTRGEAHLVQTAGKQPMIQLSDRPPNLESPIQTFRASITSNDQFFVRYHLAGVPDMKALDGWKLQVDGDAAERSVTYTQQDLNDLPQTEVVAVCQCSGNRRVELNFKIKRMEAELAARSANYRQEKFRESIDHPRPHRQWPHGLA